MLMEKLKEILLKIWHVIQIIVITLFFGVAALRKKRNRCSRKS